MEKKGSGYVLRAQPGVRVSSRAHKMSKSRGNVVNPDDVVTMYGADSLRLYEMFMGPLRDTKVRALSSEAHHNVPERLLPRQMLCSDQLSALSRGAQSAQRSGFQQLDSMVDASVGPCCEQGRNAGGKTLI